MVKEEDIFLGFLAVVAFIVFVAGSWFVRSFIRNLLEVFSR